MIITPLVPSLHKAMGATRDFRCLTSRTQLAPLKKVHPTHPPGPTCQHQHPPYTLARPWRLDSEWREVTMIQAVGPGWEPAPPRCGGPRFPDTPLKCETGTQLPAISHSPEPTAARAVAVLAFLVGHRSPEPRTITTAYDPTLGLQ